MTRWSAGSALALALALLAFSVLAGCAGKDATPADATTGDPSPPPPTGGGGAPPPTNGPVSDDEAAHHHNYWGDLTEVKVFDFDVELETFPLDSFYECNAIGFSKFTFEDDGVDDVGPDDPSPINQGSGRADVIFPGTKEIRVLINWNDSDNIPGLRFTYKPASDKLYKGESKENLPQNQCGLKVPKGQPFHIPVKPLQFDPAHQTFLSRWRFQVFASAGEGGTVPTPAVGLGKVKVQMTAIFGGHTLLDPPHPDFFAGKDSLELGTTKGHVNLTAIVDPALPTPDQVITSPLGYTDTNGKEMTDITFPRGHIAPLRMVRLEALVCLTWTGALPQTATLLVAYHGADKDEYELLRPAETRDRCGLYRIEDQQGIKADSPYESASQWGFRIVPVAQDQENLGYFEGDYTMTFTAFRK